MRSARCVWGYLTWLVLSLGVPMPVQSQTGPEATPASDACAAQRHVALSFGADLEVELQREIKADLTSDLAARGLSVCTDGADTAGRALADVRVERRDGSRYSIEVFDRTTDKRVSRDVSLARIPSNGRALAIAIAIDELLRASWAELALRVQPGPPNPTPAPPAPPTPKAAPPKRSLRLALSGSYVGSRERFDAFGGALSLESFPLGWGWLRGRAGLLRAVTRNVPEGELSVWGGQANLTLGACTALAALDARVCIGAQSELLTLRFKGTSDGSARGRARTKAILSEDAIVHLTIPLAGSWSMGLGSGLGVVLLGAQVTDGTGTVARIEGLTWKGDLSIGVAL